VRFVRIDCRLPAGYLPAHQVALADKRLRAQTSSPLSQSSEPPASCSLFLLVFLHAGAAAVPRTGDLGYPRLPANELVKRQSRSATRAACFSSLCHVPFRLPGFLAIATASLFRVTSLSPSRSRPPAFFLALSHRSGR
jgi:hypothetical protein